MATLILQRMRERNDTERSDSDATFFQSLLLSGELLTKLVTGAIIAAISDDKERQKYGFVHRLLRANGIGDWSTVLHEICTGPAAQLLDDAAKVDRKQLTSRDPDDAWIGNAIESLNECICVLGIRDEKVPRNAVLLRWFEDFAFLRNKTRGHGAKTATHLSLAAPHLERSLRSLESNLAIFMRPWAYLHRNLSLHICYPRNNCHSARPAVCPDHRWQFFHKHPAKTPKLCSSNSA
jgi:hypothetical protein